MHLGISSRTSIRCNGGKLLLFGAVPLADALSADRSQALGKPLYRVVQSDLKSNRSDQQDEGRFFLPRGRAIGSFVTFFWPDGRKG